VRAALFKAVPHMARVDEIAPANPADIERLAGIGGGNPAKAAFVSPVSDFYLTNPIARASATMAQCSALARGERAVAAE
jgi:NADH-quinone oxidoreductase subunit G